MKRTGTTRIASAAKASKWLAWATRFESRFHRHAGALRMALLLGVRNNRTAVRIEERQLRQVLNFNPQFLLSIDASTRSQVSSAFAPQMNFLTHVTVARNADDRREAATAANRVASPAPLGRLETVLRTATETRREFASSIERRFAERRDSVTLRATERLLHRSERIETNMLERAMTLRRDPAAAVRTAADAGSAANARTFEQRARQGHQQLAVATPMPPVNVEQLADQVIRQIDRRVTARRERMGRT
jgi:hypothetical protein